MTVTCMTRIVINVVFCEEMTFPAHLFQKKSKKPQGILAVVDLLYCWMIWKRNLKQQKKTKKGNWRFM